MDDNLQWFEQFYKSENIQTLLKNPIAYFCAEYALSSNIPIYAGGLGVLAGDLLREASDRHFPIVAVGLYYNDGYQTLHRVDSKGYIEAPHTHSLPQNYGLTEVLDQNQKPIFVTVPIQDRDVYAKAWLWRAGNVTVYLLDTNVDENSALDRKITDHLYVIDKETRLKQEMILGIGGARLLEILNIKPSIYHMNEGHSALLALELIRSEMLANKSSLEEAQKVARGKIVFTNHTLVISGNEVFSQELVSLNLSRYADTLGIPMAELLNLGKIEDSNEFSLTTFALNLAGQINAVSQLHAKKAKELWPSKSLIPVTNGIHIPTWNLFTEENSFWTQHLENKNTLLTKINLEKEKVWAQTDLIIGWARRIVSYKRPLAALFDLVRLKQLILTSKVPVRFVFAGTLHPSDTEAVATFNEFRKIIDEDLQENAVFLPEYNMDAAKVLVAGCDVWLNTPIVGFEACGTSGMKAALNGVLPCSTKDGWMDEIDFYEVGWPLDDDTVTDSFLDTLEHKIIPLFSEKDGNGTPIAWEKNMRNARNLIRNRYSTTRMLREYIEKLYLPLLTSKA